MQWKEDRGLRRAVATTVTLIVILIIMAIYGCAVDDTPAKSEPTPPSPYDAHLLEVDKEALEVGYRQQLAHVYSTWMRDYHLGQSYRAATGFANARAAYIQAKQELEKREQALKK